MTVCDVCGDPLSSENMISTPAEPVVAATNRGYVPSRLPSTWYSQCRALGIDIGDHW